MIIKELRNITTHISKSQLEEGRLGGILVGFCHLDWPASRSVGAFHRLMFNANEFVFNTSLLRRHYSVNIKMSLLMLNFFSIFMYYVNGVCFYETSVPRT